MWHVTLKLTSPSHRPCLITFAGQSLLQAIIVNHKMQWLFGFDTWEFVTKQTSSQILMLMHDDPTITRSDASDNLNNTETIPYNQEIGCPQTHDFPRCFCRKVCIFNIQRLVVCFIYLRKLSLDVLTSKSYVLIHIRCLLSLLFSKVKTHLPITSRKLNPRRF